MESTTIIIDGNYVLHKNFYIFKNFKNEKYMTGTTFGFIKDVLKLNERFNTNDIHVTWDSRSFRKEINSDYKSNRVRDPENNPYQDFNLVQDAIDSLGIKQYKVNDMEGDDIIYSLSKRFSNVIIYSRDKDLFQCINDNVKILTELEGELIGENEFEKNYGFKFSRDNFVLYKCVVGDGSDNVKGIPRFRKKDIVEYINTGIMKQKSFDIFNENQELINNNKKMFELVNLDKLDPIFETQYSDEKINDIFNKTSIKFFKSDSIKKLKK
jgi:5'-3' exonuclease